MCVCVCVCVCVYVYVLGAMKLCLTSPCRNQEMVREENVGVIDGNNPKILFIYLFWLIVAILIDLIEIDLA